MIDIAPLLEPVSPEKPCGEDVSYDPRYLELETMIAGKPETQFSQSEEPNWQEMQRLCAELLAVSKNLRVTVTMALVFVRVDGIPGLADGLRLLLGMLERYWADLYPKLDPADNNDPLERINVISSIATPMATFGDPVRFLERVRMSPLANSPRMGKYTFADVTGDKRVLKSGEEQPPVSPEEIAGAFRDTKPEELVETARLLAEAGALVKQIDEFLMKTVGSSRALNLEPLLTLIKDMAKAVGPYLPVEAGAAAEDGQPAAAGEGANWSKGAGIKSRSDVIQALESICNYYRRAEPSSPIPYLLERAKRVVEMDFLAIVGELTPESKPQAENVVGYKREGG